MGADISLTAKFLYKVRGAKRVIAGITGHKEADHTNHDPERATAYHEAGHVVAGAYSGYLTKDFYDFVTVKPIDQVNSFLDRKALHRAHHARAYVKPTDEFKEEMFSKYILKDEKELYGAMVMFYGGMAAECEVFGDDERFEYGRGNDVANAKFLAKIIALKQSGSDDFIKSCRDVMASPVIPKASRGYINMLWRKHNNSFINEAELEDKVEKLIGSAKKDAFKIIKTHREKLDFIAHGLLEKGTLSRDEIAHHLDY